MWTIIKFDKKKFNFLLSELQNKFGTESKIYRPIIFQEKFEKNKLIKKEYDLLGDYLFCFDKTFSSENSIKRLNYVKGVKYYLSGFMSSQNEIIKFIEYCKSKENYKGVITKPIYETKVGNYYRFASGPFTQKIFKILEIQKNKIQILMGNLETTVDKKDYSLNPL
tara:strand:+ start:566 stop:1063 length:498 start_codon:yes stop_codon:yes gene_type:complete